MNACTIKNSKSARDESFLRQSAKKKMKSAIRIEFENGKVCKTETKNEYGVNIALVLDFGVINYATRYWATCASSIKFVLDDGAYKDQDLSHCNAEDLAN